MPLTSKDLEMMADHLLADELNSQDKYKSRHTEYPILSESQLKRRSMREIPYSNLSSKQKLEARMKDWDIGKEGIE